MNKAQQELRNLMQQKRKLSEQTASSGVSSKDKVKLLKMMREKKKEEVVLTKPTDMIRVKNLPNPPQPYKPCMGIPAVTSNSRDVVVSTNTSDISAPIVNDNPRVDSSLPQGFFDDPVKDAQARGIDLHKELEKQESANETALEAFLGEVKDLQELQDEAEQTDETYKEMEEEALQMSYTAKLITLYNKSSKVLSKNRVSLQSSSIEMSSPAEDFEQKILQESKELTTTLLLMGSSLQDPNDEDDSDEVGNDEEGDEDKGKRGGDEGGGRSVSSKQTNESNMNSATSDSSIEAILRQRQEEAKRRKAAAEAVAFAPIDFADWTARSIW